MICIHEGMLSSKIREFVKGRVLIGRDFFCITSSCFCRKEVFKRYSLIGRNLKKMAKAIHGNCGVLIGRDFKCILRSCFCILGVSKW